MSQAGTPQITPAAVLAQLQLEKKELALAMIGISNPILSAGEVLRLQQSVVINAILLTAMQRYVGWLSTQAPPAPTTLTVSTPGDVITAAKAIYIADTLSRKITCTGPTPAQVYQTTKDPSVWISLPDTADGGKVWQDQHNDGQTLTLYNCLPGILQGSP